MGQDKDEDPPECDGKIRFLQNHAVPRRYLGHEATQVDLVRSLGINREKFRGQLTRKKLTTETQSILAEKFGFGVNWPEWLSGTAEQFKEHYIEAVLPLLPNTDIRAMAEDGAASESNELEQPLESESRSNTNALTEGDRNLPELAEVIPSLLSDALPSNPETLTSGDDSLRGKNTPEQLLAYESQSSNVDVLTPAVFDSLETAEVAPPLTSEPSSKAENPTPGDDRLTKENELKWSVVSWTQRIGVCAAIVVAITVASFLLWHRPVPYVSRVQLFDEHASAIIAGSDAGGATPEHTLTSLTPRSGVYLRVGDPRTFFFALGFVLHNLEIKTNDEMDFKISVDGLPNDGKDKVAWHDDDELTSVDAWQRYDVVKSVGAAAVLKALHIEKAKEIPIVTIIECRTTEELARWSGDIQITVQDRLGDKANHPLPQPFHIQIDRFQVADAGDSSCKASSKQP